MFKLITFHSFNILNKNVMQILHTRLLQSLESVKKFFYYKTNALKDA